jgi:hypothetical protein
MKNQMTAMVTIALLTASLQALAAEPAKPAPAAAAPPAEKAAAPAAPMTPPKPAPENEMFKKSSGTWNCEGTSKGPDGTESKYKSSWTIKPILGGHWYSVVYKRAKAGTRPAFEGDATIGYNTRDKKYALVGVDSMGGSINLTSTDNSVYTGEGGATHKTPIKFTFTPGKDKKGQESDKLFDVTLDFGVATSQESCKK